MLMFFPADAQATQSEFPPLGLVAQNLAATDLTVAVEIGRVHKVRVIFTDGGSAGYILWRINGRVFECYKGRVSVGSEISYYAVIETGLERPAAGGRAIVSLRKKASDWVIPDAGYAFAYSPERDALYKSATGGKACEMGTGLTD